MVQPFENGKIVNWQQEVQNIRLAAGSEAQNGAIFWPGPKLPQKVSRKEKIQNFANFDLKFWLSNGHAKKLWELKFQNNPITRKHPLKLMYEQRANSLGRTVYYT